MESQIRYLAIVSERPEMLANFYSRYFTMRELGRSDNGDVALTDGFYNISILKPRDGADELGISHFGVTIDDIGQVEARLKEFAPNTEIVRKKAASFMAIIRVTDPSGQPWFFPPISSTRRASSAPSRAFAISRCVSQTTTTCSIFTSMFLAFASPRPARRIRAENRVVRWAADGATAMAILPDRTRRDMNERESPRDGLNHFGWLVNDIEPFLNSLPEGCVSQRPSSRPMAEYRGFDPDRNPFDISQDKGYEIDIDRWVHG